MDEAFFESLKNQGVLTLESFSISAMLKLKTCENSNTGRALKVDLVIISVVLNRQLLVDRVQDSPRDLRIMPLCFHIR